MAVTSVKVVTVTYTGDVIAVESFTSGTNAVSPGQIELKTLSAGANTITVPTGGSIPTSCTIIPPALNAIAITLKGVSGDTGIRLHNTDPTSIALDPSVVNFVLNAVSQVTGIRLVWS